jgi:hypothetical protein
MHLAIVASIARYRRVEPSWPVRVGPLIRFLLSILPRVRSGYFAQTATGRCLRLWLLSRLLKGTVADVEATFTFDADLYLHSGGSWVFLAVPADDSDDISEMVPTRNGFGSVRVRAQIGDTEWMTSVFPDSKRKVYVLPVKKPVRKAECIDAGDTVAVSLSIALE